MIILTSPICLWNCLFSPNLCPLTILNGPSRVKIEEDYSQHHHWPDLFSGEVHERRISGPRITITGPIGRLFHWKVTCSFSEMTSLIYRFSCSIQLLSLYSKLWFSLDDTFSYRLLIILRSIQSLKYRVISLVSFKILSNRNRTVRVQNFFTYKKDPWEWYSSYFFDIFVLTFYFTDNWGHGKIHNRTKEGTHKIRREIKTFYPVRRSTNKRIILNNSCGHRGSDFYVLWDNFVSTCSNVIFKVVWILYI